MKLIRRSVESILPIPDNHGLILFTCGCISHTDYEGYEEDYYCKEHSNALSRVDVGKGLLKGTA